MIVNFVEMAGFRGYQKTVRVDLAPGFTVIDGRNGAGKSTLFDAIEFVLTGTLTKYSGATASRESVEDYIWWRGEGAAVERYVEVGFTDGIESFVVRRGRVDAPDEGVMALLLERLCDQTLAPPSPLAQLCSSAIIRDEHISSLCLDLKETDRYTLLRHALGAVDSDTWIKRGAQVVSFAKRNTSAAEEDVTTANAEVAATARRLDETRANLVDDAVISEAAARLRSFCNTNLPPDQLASVARERIARTLGEIEALTTLAKQWPDIESKRSRSEDLAALVATARAQREAAVARLNQLPASVGGESFSALATEARSLVELVTLGRRVGLHDDRCPLCATKQSEEQFTTGTRFIEDLAKQLDEKAASAEQQEQARNVAQLAASEAVLKEESAEIARQQAMLAIESFEKQYDALGLRRNENIGLVTERIDRLGNQVEVAQSDLRILGTLRLSVDLERAISANETAVVRLTQAQERFGKARKVEGLAEAIHDAARRTASETLDLRLERVLPLMSELYQRLRPHPVWHDIEYSIRGDVRRFLKLQVGGDLNPQFLFSSGQRRATGLAFLLSVNLSLAWSRWKTILLDDPVQHVDDFRAIHLAELLAQLVAEGRQVICAVEDAALADLIGRRLPITGLSSAKRITLGVDEDGALAITEERELPPLPSNALVGQKVHLAAG